LLSQIRNFGGDKKKLKNIENRKTETKKKKQEAKESGGLPSLDDALKQALKERRGFMDGSKLDKEPKKSKEKPELPSLEPTTRKEPDENKIGMLDRISIMIPPPPTQNSDDDESDSEWE
jgi:hypothetical protein